MLKSMIAPLIFATSIILPAQAEIYDFSFAQGGGGTISASGIFETTISGVGSSAYSSPFTNIIGGITGSNGTYAITSADGVILSTANGSVLNFTIHANTVIIQYDNNPVTVSLSNFSSNVEGNILTAFLSSSSSPAGGSGGGSGGAPTPEVNLAFGLILTGATFAFLRRRRPIRFKAAAI